jgi:hypothetical protein
MTLFEACSADDLLNETEMRTHMLEAAWAWFSDPLVQSILISPLISAILGVLFSGLSGPPLQISEVSTQPRVIIQKHTTVINNTASGSGNSEDGLAIMIGALLLMAVIVGAYSAYSIEILKTVLAIILGCLAFVLTAAITSVIRGYHRSNAWFLHILFPLASLGFCFYLVYLAQTGLIPGAREAARNNGLIVFYFKILNHEQRTWMMLQVLGVALLLLLSLASACGALHYLACINQYGSSRLSGMWVRVVMATRLVSGWRGVAAYVLLGGVAFIMLSGTIYQWLK